VIGHHGAMTRGTVKFWKADKGWGAISSPELPAGRDAFAHFSEVVGSGYRILAEGDEVEFDVVERSQDSFGYVAENIRKQ
jgi:cold shock protein